ncbi:MAG TPA: hypothetical protein K8V56_13670 [Sporosarcina psychrophila]|uniref:Uncharacterized protein n=1 Tax=Sporosarcina psychrophila TaxID=1476 RepID=A0A921G2P1_SPOPS|nr:hypothetical protein [Sporosarcina psychrophila]
MEINQAGLDEIKAEFAERHQLSVEEVSRMIDGVVVGITAMAEEMARLWGSIKEFVQENYTKALWNMENEAMQGWNVNWDTRKHSQIIDRKPRHLIKKIIR